MKETVRSTEDRFTLHRSGGSPVRAESNLIILDPAMALVELLGDKLEGLGHTVDGYTEPADVVALAGTRSATPPEVLLVDLVFPTTSLTGLDAMMAFRRTCPETALIIYTAARSQDATLLRVIWEAINPASAVSKLSPVASVIETIETVRELGRAEVDPRLQALIPHKRSPWRTADGYRRLVPHAGHAKLWKALLDCPTPPPYKVIADESRLSVNTIRNYRDDLLTELRLHGLDNPTMQQMHEFAHSVRPLLAPVLADRLDGGTDRPPTAAVTACR